MRLYSENGNIKKIFWNNDYPSSVCLCRPIALIFQKESTDLTNEVIAKMNAEIATLEPTKIGKVSVSATICFTMVDTKVINDLTKTHSQKCYICQRSGKVLNLPLETNDSDDPEKYRFGMSPLHAYIRTMEIMLKIAYRLVMEKPAWRVSKANVQVKQREEVIKTAFREQLGLRIGEPRPGGGNSNSGNVARSFFKQREAVAEITGLDKELLERFYVILTLINSKAEIRMDAYRVSLDKIIVYIKCFM